MVSEKTPRQLLKLTPKCDHARTPENTNANGECRICRRNAAKRANSRVYYFLNYEKERTRSRAWYQRNRAKRLVSMAAYRQRLRARYGTSNLHANPTAWLWWHLDKEGINGKPYVRKEWPHKGNNYGC